MSSLSETTWFFCTAGIEDQPGRDPTVAPDWPQQTVSARKIRAGALETMYSVDRTG